MKNIPNILSVLRILMVGAFAYLFLIGQSTTALFVYVLAFCTDVLDGYLARRNGWITNAGKLLDPLADKLLIVTVLICIYIGKRESAYLILFMLSAVKELLMVIGGFILFRRNTVVYADWFGKIATGVFAAGIVLSLLSFRFLAFHTWDFAVLLVATILSYVAMGHYALQNFLASKRKETAKSER